MSLHAMHLGRHIHCGNWLLRIVESTQPGQLTMAYIYESPLGSQEEPRYCGQVEVPASMRNLDTIARYALDCAVRGGQDDRGVEARHTRMLVHGSQIRRRGELDLRQCWVLREADGYEFGATSQPQLKPQPEPQLKPLPEPQPEPPSEPVPEPQPELLPVPQPQPVPQPEPQPEPLPTPEPTVTDKRRANMAKARIARGEKQRKAREERKEHEALGKA